MLHTQVFFIIKFHKFVIFIMYIKSVCVLKMYLDCCAPNLGLFFLLTFNALNAKWRHLCFVVVILVYLCIVVFLLFFTYIVVVVCIHILQRNYFRPLLSKVGPKISIFFIAFRYK